MAGKRSFDRDFCGLRVANFADHDDVRVLTQDGAQGVSESKPNFLFDGNLIDAWDLELNRIFNGNDVENWVVQFIESGIKRGGLAGTGRSGDEDQTVWRIHCRLHLLQRVRVET